ncbi:MAG: protein kinase [Polyangia bacterium]
MAQQPADLIGRTLCRTYQVERLLGGGGMGAVYAARHVRTGGLFAVKILHRETAADADIYKRFQDEAKTVSALRHPHIVQVTDFDRDEDGTPFIVMELLEGEDLYQRLCRVNKLPVEQVLDIGRQVGSALHAAHEKGVIHRDIKPQNIFLVRHEVAEDVHETAKVVDFGISKIRRTGGQMTRDMTILGTPQFMSPEAALGQNSQLDGRADQWSLAVIMYLSLTGKLPFDGENLVGVLYQVVHEKPTPIRQLAPEVPEILVAAIERAMSKKKDDRFPRMVDFVRALTGQSAGAASVRLGMASAVFRSAAVPAVAAVPPGSPAPFVHSPMPESAATAPNAVPPSQPQLGAHAASAAAADAPTAAPHLLPGALPATQPNLPAPGELPLTMPLVSPGPPGPLVATPTSPTAFVPASTPVPRSAPPPPRQPTGNTPTNIALTDADMQALMGGAEPTPAPGSEADAAGDLQGVPTRVVMPAPAANETVPLNERRASATVPLHVLRPPEQGSPFDSAYPSTLSRATGEEISLRPSLLPRLDWKALRSGALKLLGVAPRSPVRMAVTGGVLALIVVLIVVLATSGGAAPSVESGPVGAASPAVDGGAASPDAAAAAAVPTQTSPERGGTGAGGKPKPTPPKPPPLLPKRPEKKAALSSRHA